MLKIKYLELEEEVFDINVKDNHNFFANDILVHNCVEITQTTVPMESMEDDIGEISLCTLASYNLGNIKTPEDFERPAKILVRFLDNILDYQDIPIKAGRTSTNKYRHLGIGVMNLAYFLAKHNQSYSSETAPEFLHPFAEAMAYYTIKASVALSKERGKFPAYENTKWAQGILPIDKYRPFMDTIVPNNLFQDWEKLRKDVNEYGIRHASLMAIAPVETSSQMANSVNGIEPPRSLVSVKGSKDGASKQVVPEIQRLKNKYELLWDQKSPRGYLALAGVFNKFICQSISTNTSYNSEHYEKGEIPMSILLGDIIYSYQLGLRTLYYNNEYDGNAEMDVQKEMDKIDNSTEVAYNLLSEQFEDENCDSCVI